MDLVVINILVVFALFWFGMDALLSVD